jgi:hypothetical protein
MARALLFTDPSDLNARWVGLGRGLFCCFSSAGWLFIGMTLYHSCQPPAVTVLRATGSTRPCDWVLPAHTTQLLQHTL